MALVRFQKVYFLTSFGKLLGPTASLGPRGSPRGAAMSVWPGLSSDPGHPTHCPGPGSGGSCLSLGDEARWVHRPWVVFFCVNGTLDESTSSSKNAVVFDSVTPPSSSVHGIPQARILEWVAISYSRGSSCPRDRTWVSCIAGRFFTVC
ncbi:hypothetical protein JEQ12_009322 [Ovis aries]|uniref:Uncharacterized protein n=1 Tax=Ovis aries TaxID=9940 RepID=A0A836AAV6_SHEEP|nr:hypothetical protein JEQ12_009322 [Ovis aries]